MGRRRIALLAPLVALLIAGCSNHHQPVPQCLAAVPAGLDLVSVWGSAPDDVWVGGLRLDKSPAPLLHWNGACWQSMEGVVSGWGVFGTGPDDIWAFDIWTAGPDFVVSHFDGDSWTKSRMSGGGSYYALWIGSSTDAWAVGARGSLRHWDGSAWRSDPSWTFGLNLADLHSVWGSATDDVWAVGTVQLDPYATAGILVRWDGTKWQEILQLDRGEQLSGVWGRAADDVWVTGIDSRGFILRHCCQDGPWEVSCVHDPWIPSVGGTAPDDLWLAGRATGGIGEIVHWDGTACTTVVASGTYDPLGAVWALSRDDAWIVGANSTIIHWDGTQWSRSP